MLGIEHLSEFDRHEPALETVLGQSYQSSTLTQFLGQLERIEAAEALMPLLLPPGTSEMTYIDARSCMGSVRVKNRNFSKSAFKS